MAFASITYTSASGTTFALTNSDGNAIEYLRQSDISVTVNGTLQTLTTDYTFNSAGTSIVLNSAVSNATVVIARTTSITDATVSFTAGSTLTAQDLNNSDRQNRFALQEFSDIYDSLRSGTGDLGDLGGFIDAGETWVSDAAHAATTDAIDARVDSKIDTALTGDVAAGNAITITDNSPASGQITIAVTDGAIDTAELADGAVTTAKITDSNVTTAKINDAAVTTAKLADANVTTAKIADDAITSAKIADGTIIAGDIAGSAVTTAKIADSNVTTAKIADSAITNAKLATDAVTQAKLADDSVGSAEIIDSAITTAKISTAAVTTAKIADSNVTTAKIADGAVTNVKLADAELQELATMGGTTAAALADLTAAEVQILDGATVTTAELNTLDGITANVTELNQLDGNTLTNSPTWTSASQYPTAAAIDSRITARIDPIGGFEAIADEDSFPATAPPEGTVVSIANANGLAVNASGVGAGTRAGGSDPVVINGFPAGFNSTSLDDGIGLLVISTSTAHTYDFHRVVAKDEDVRQLSSDINDFKARYRVGSTEPTTDNDAGDLFFDTAADAMKVRNAANTAWGVVQSTGDFILLGLRDENASTGPTFNGSNTVFDLKRRDDLSVAASVDQAGQLLVSVNGVIQNANAGTTITGSDEGYVLSESDEITFATAPPTGAEVFVVQLGTATDIGTPSDGTVTNVKVSASAAIAGTKISPDFGSQNVVTTGSMGVGTSSPSTTLHVDGTATVDRIINATTSSDPWLKGVNGSGTETSFIKQSGEAYLTKLGINTTNPIGPLEINMGTDKNIAFQGGIGEIGSVPGFQGVNDAANALTSIGMRGTDIRFACGSSERARIDSSGRLLVGTPSTSNAYTSILAQGNASGANTEGLIRLATENSSPGDGAGIGGVLFCASNHGDTAAIRAFRDGGTWTNDSSEPTRIAFSTTADGASSSLVRMQIKANGQVGIGGVPDSSALLGIEAASTAELSDSNGLYNQSNPAFFQIKNTTDGISDPECGIILQPRNSSNGAVALYAKRTGSFRSDLIYRVRTGSATSQENIRFLNNGGISFNGDTAAANALDDYEEGTHTCTASNSVTLNSSINQISYTKIGRMVTVGGQIQVTNSNSSSALELSLPFTVKSNSEGDALYTGAVRLYAANVAGDAKWVICQTTPGAATVQFVNVRDNTPTSLMTATDNGYYMFQLTYPVA